MTINYYFQKYDGSDIKWWHAYAFMVSAVLVYIKNFI